MSESKRVKESNIGYIDTASVDPHFKYGREDFIKSIKSLEHKTVQHLLYSSQSSVVAVDRSEGDKGYSIKYQRLGTQPLKFELTFHVSSWYEQYREIAATLHDPKDLVANKEITIRSYGDIRSYKGKVMWNLSVAFAYEIMGSMEDWIQRMK